MTESADLERDLTALGPLLDAPNDEYLVTRVRAAVEGAPRRRRRRLAVVVVALVAVGVVSAPVVADRLGVGRVEVRHEQPPRGAPLSPLDLGRRTTLRGARDAVGFVVVVPASLGTPDEVWLDRSEEGDVVWLAYRPRADLPAVRATGYGALVAQAGGSVDEDILGTKFIEPDTRIERVEVGTGNALWIEGIHSVAFTGRSGEFRFDRLRLSDKVLLWERGAVTMRLESSLDKEDSLRIARSAP